jgi:ParB-like chromosome segregation protein Spo0J
MINWIVKSIPITKLEEWKGNPRKISKENFELLKASFEKFGHARTLTVNPLGDKFEIIGGNQSKRALKELGYKEINCNIPDRELTEDEKKELSVKLNNINKGQGEWD